MKRPDGLPPDLGEGVLIEPGSSDGRIVLWLPGESAGGYRYWERIGTVARAGAADERGVCTVAATSVAARQRLGGGLADLFRRRAVPRGARTWSLPGGGEAEQCGERRAGLMLAWCEDGSPPRDRIHDRWPGCGDVRAIGPALYLLAEIDASGPPVAVAGIPAVPPGPDVGKADPGGPPSGPAIPRLAPGSSREMVRQALAILAGDPGPMARRAASWERLAAQIVEHGRKNGSTWGMERLRGADDSIIYMGRAAEFLVFDAAGRLFRGQGTGCLAGSRGGVLVPHYPGMRPES